LFKLGHLKVFEFFVIPNDNLEGNGVTFPLCFGFVSLFFASSIVLKTLNLCGKTSGR